MTNIERLKLAIEGINISDNNLNIYLLENSLAATDEYKPDSNINKKQIYKTALSILEDIANNPQNMKNYKTDDITISNFSDNIQSRIEQLEKKIRQIPSDDITSQDGSSFVYMFNS